MYTSPLPIDRLCVDSFSLTAPWWDSKLHDNKGPWTRCLAYGKGLVKVCGSEFLMSSEVRLPGGGGP